MTAYQLTFAPYQRHFAQPLRTSRGSWSIREGIIVTLTNKHGRQSSGEIAPLPQFGTEKLAQAIALCTQFNGSITQAEINQIPDQFPASQFGFGSALMGFDWTPQIQPVPPQKLCQLIPATTAAQVDPKQIENFLKQGHQTFKVKLPCGQIPEDIALCTRVLELLPDTAQLRLDANGGLQETSADQLFAWADTQSQIEFIEQPKRPEQWHETLALQAKYQTAIALDESVCNITQLQAHTLPESCFIYVIKAAIMGFPSRLREFGDRHPELDLVFSTVFETTVGQQFVLRLAQAYGNPERAYGFGGKHWFKAEKA